MDWMERCRRLGRVACVSLATSPVFGQPFEALYGTASSHEFGRKVRPVVACSGGGYVVVGTSAPPGLPSRVYVLRVGANGATIWERTYSVNYTARNGGSSIVEARDGTGFYVAGFARFDASASDVLLMKIDCNGLPWWAWTYDSVHPLALGESAVDIVEAQYGDPVAGTHRGDLLVAGGVDAPPTSDGWLGNASFLMRTSASGVLIWNRRYASNARPNERFHALIEAKPSSSGRAGDVVAVGLWQNPGDWPQGYAVRVSGNTGLAKSSPHGAVVVGRDGSGWLDSVVELRGEGDEGQLVLVGHTTKIGSASGIHLVRTAADPVVVKVQRRIGESWEGGASGHDATEVLKGTSFARAGDLALTGFAATEGAPGGDAFLLLVDPDSLEPLAGTGRLYGDHGSSTEWGESLIAHAGGFVLTGNFEGKASSDPNDVYLVSTGGSGHTSCDREWSPRNSDPAVPVEPVTLSAESFLRQTTHNIWSWILDGPGRGGCLDTPPRWP